MAKAPRRWLAIIVVLTVATSVVVAGNAWRSRSSASCDGAGSLQRRIDQARPGEVIEVEGDVCLARRIVISGKQKLVLAGLAGAVLRQGQGVDDKMIVIADSSEVTLRDLEIAGASASAGNRPGAYSPDTAGAAAIALKGSRSVVLERLHVHDVYGDFVDIEGDGRGTFTSAVTIRDNRFERSGRQGVSFGRDVRDVTVSGNRFVSVRRSVFDFEPSEREAVTTNVSITGNRAVDYRNFFVTVAGIGQLDGLVIKDNAAMVKGGTNGGLAFVRVGARKEGIALVTGLRMCGNTGNIVDRNRLAGAVDPVTTCDDE